MSYKVIVKPYQPQKVYTATVSGTFYSWDDTPHACWKWNLEALNGYSIHPSSLHRLEEKGHLNGYFRAKVSFTIVDEVGIANSRHAVIGRIDTQ